MEVRDKLVELLRPWLAHLSLAAANDLIENGVTVQEHGYWETVVEVRDNTVCGNGAKIEYKRCSRCKKPAKFFEDDFLRELWRKIRFDTTAERRIKCLFCITRNYAETDCGDFYPDWDEVDPETVVPTVDSAFVVHGRWLPTNDDNKKRCSQCDVIHFIAQYPHGQANYCPNCGAKMDGGNEDDL